MDKDRRFVPYYPDNYPRTTQNVIKIRSIVMFMYELRDKIVVQNVGTYSQRPTVNNYYATPSTYIRQLVPIYDIKGAVNRGDNHRKKTVV